MSVWSLDKWCINFGWFLFGMVVTWVPDGEAVATVVWVVIAKVGSGVEEIVRVVLFNIGLSTNSGSDCISGNNEGSGKGSLHR